MQEPELRQFASVKRWRPCDFLAAACLFFATAAVILWQNAHLAVLWDLSYVLETAARISLGQMPYCDFPLAHAPLTFLLQAAIIRLTGRVFLHHVFYVAAAGGLGTVATWRIARNVLSGRVRQPRLVSLLLAAPLCVLGIYCILPHPSYDCDCALSILVALLLLQKIEPDGTAGESRWRGFAAGAAAVLPLFFKQNIGLPFLAITVAVILLVIAVRAVRRVPVGVELPAVLAGVAAMLLIIGLTIHFTAGIGNYFRWTIRFAAQRRMPGLVQMVDVYAQPSLVWMLACVAGAMALVRSQFGKSKWIQVIAFVLFAAPFLWTIWSLFLYDDADERTDAFLALWPFLLILSAALAIAQLFRGITLRALLPVVVLATIHGTLLSQQLWGSTYGIWPLLVVLVAEMIALSAEGSRTGLSRLMPPPLAIAVVIAATLLICGGYYTASEERLSYAQMPEGPVLHSNVPQLKGISASGPYLPEFEELLRFAETDIPIEDGILLLPGEDPFYFVTGRVPHFPVLLFDPATQPYTPSEMLELARAENIRWLIVKRNLQINEDPTPQRDATMAALLRDFVFAKKLAGYDIYRRR